MRRLLAAFLLGAAASAFADASDWYTPAGQWNGGDIGISSVAFGESFYLFGIDAAGRPAGDGWDDLSADFGGDPVMDTALNSMKRALQAQVMAENIASKLDTLSLTYDDGTGAKRSVKISPSTGGAPTSNAQTELKLPKRVNADGVTLKETSEGNGILLGWASVPPPAPCYVTGTASGGYFFEPAVVSTNGVVEVDGVTLETRTEKDGDGKERQKTGIKGWKDGGACEANLSQMLTDESDAENRQNHEILCRYGGTASGELHYLPVGAVIQPQLSADGVTISTNETGYVGMAAICGAHEEANGGKALFSTGAGIAWKDIPPGGAAITFVGTDGIGVTVGSGATTNTVTFASASDSNVKVSVSGGGTSVKVEIGVYYK